MHFFIVEYPTLLSGRLGGLVLAIVHLQLTSKVQISRTSIFVPENAFMFYEGNTLTVTVDWPECASQHV